MKIEQCKNCKYFIQHYGIYKGEGIFKLECGHCLKSKRKQALIKECPNFEEQTDNYCSETFRIAKLLYQAHSSCADLCEKVAELRRLFSEEIFKFHSTNLH